MQSRYQCILIALIAILAISTTEARARRRKSNPGAIIPVKTEAEFFAALNLDYEGLDAVKRAVAAEDWTAAKAAWAKHLESRKSPTWLWSHHDWKEIKRFLDAQGETLESNVKKADTVLRREFNFLGIKKTLPKDIPWEGHKKEWGNVLNRHAYWKDMGLAWRKTGDAKYAEDWVFMARDWVQDNPATRGGKPWRVLEVGMRAYDWFEVMTLFMDAPAFDAETKYLLTRSLINHANSLHNTEVRSPNWNQTMKRGLAAIGIMLPEFKAASAWRKRGFEGVAHGIASGVLPDGTHAERTTNYHFWAALGVADIMILARKNGYAIEGQDRHEKMFEFLMYASTPDRRFMTIGNSGYGKNIEKFLGLGALLYDRPDMRYLATDEVAPEWIWMFPPEKLAKYANLKKEVPSKKSHMMPHSKFGIMRTGWDRDARVMLFDCSDSGGGHSHGDTLQVTLYSGRHLLIDPGQISYDDKRSRSFKSHDFHNVVLFGEKGGIGINVGADVLSWDIKDRVEFGAGRISEDGKAHQRSVLFVKPDYWVIVDHVEGDVPSTTRLFHMLDRTVTKTDKTVRTNYKDGDNLWITCADDATVEMREGLARVLPGNMVESSIAAFVSSQKLPSALCTVLVPFGNEREIPTVKRLETGHPDHVGLLVTFPDGRADGILIAKKPGDLSLGRFTGKGIALCVRKAGTSETVDVLQAGWKQPN